MNWRDVIMHWSEMEVAPSAEPLATEAGFYLRVAGRHLFEGHYTRWVLIKGEEVIGIWGTREAAELSRSARVVPQQPLVSRRRCRVRDDNR